MTRELSARLIRPSRRREFSEPRKPPHMGFSMLLTGVELSLQALSDHCEPAKSLLQSLRPQMVSTTNLQRPAVIYTDGAFGDGLLDWSAIVIDPLRDCRRCFAGRVPDLLWEAWHRLLGEQRVCQIEMYAVLCVRWHLLPWPHKRRALLFIEY